MIKGSLLLHLGPIWYHSEPSDVPYSQNLPRQISWIGLFLQQNDSNNAKCRWRSDRLDGAVSFRELLGQKRVMKIHQGGDNP